MEITVNDLLTFCSYYTLAKTNAKLSHLQHPEKAEQIAQLKPKGSKNIRKKFEDVEPKKIEKTLKPKLQYTSKLPRKQASPIHRQELRELQEDANKRYDISYFVSHMTAKPSQYGATAGGQQERWNRYPKKDEAYMQNYQTFGRSRTKTMDFQTFHQKLQKDRNLYTDRQQRPQTFSSQLIFRSENKAAFDSSDSWWNQTPMRKVSPFIDRSAKKSFYVAPTFENISTFQQSHSRAYSPINRQNTPNSRLGNSPDSQLSKSKTKHQRKKSQRPFYDASKLTLKEEDPPLSSRREPVAYSEAIEFHKERKSNQQKNLTQSYLSVQENQSYMQPKNLVQIGRDPKRQTSTTAPPSAIQRDHKIVPYPQRETDLDDQLGETLTELSTRKAPVAFELRISN